MSYRVSLPSGAAGEEHYEAGALFRTKTSNSSVVASSSPNRSVSFSDLVGNPSAART